MAVYPTPDPRTIRRPRRPGEPPEPTIQPEMAPMLPIQPRSVRPEPPMVEAIGAEPTSLPTANPTAPVAGPNDIAGSEGLTGVAAPPMARPEAPGTRHGIGGRIKDFLETLLYTGGNPIAAGLAAGKTGLLANYKENVFNRPQRQKDQAFETEQAAAQEAARYRQAQQRKIEADIAEDQILRPHRIKQMEAETELRGAQARRAGEPSVAPQRNAQVFETAAGLMERDPSTGVWRLAQTEGGGPMSKPVAAPRTELTPGEQATQTRYEQEQSQQQTREGEKFKGDFERLKSDLTEAAAEFGRMATELGNPSFAETDKQGQPILEGKQQKRSSVYKGKYITDADVAAAKERRDSLQRQFDQMRQSAGQYPTVELDESGVGIRPRANARSASAGAAGGRTVTYQGKKWRVVNTLPNGELELEPM